MNTKLVLATSILCLALLLILYPQRRVDPFYDTEQVVEIIYMGPGGPIKGAMDDAVKEFERLSHEAHEQDSSKPIYQVISGQTAARNQVADPTRFLVSVAGGVPPDVIYFDRYAVAEWAARGAFMPLDPFIDRDIAAGRDTPRLERFYKSCLDEAVYKGQVYAIPNSVDDRALFFNMDLLKRAGLVDENGEVMMDQASDVDGWGPGTAEKLRTILTEANALPEEAERASRRSADGQPPISHKGRGATATPAELRCLGGQQGTRTHGSRINQH